MFLNKKRHDMYKNVEKLNEGLRAKFEKFCTIHFPYICDIFTWEEFKEVFLKVPFMTSFQYKDTIFSIFNCGNYAEFWIDGNDKESYRKYENAGLLLENVRVGGESLQELWQELIVF